MAPLAQFPDLPALAEGLASVFGRKRSFRPPLAVLRRKPASEATTFPCEVVTCRLGSGKRIQLFCKYAAEDGVLSHGQRGGLAYEAQVYSEVLGPSASSTPDFYGVYADPQTGGTWLILEYLERTVRAGAVAGLAGMRLAARWIGRFHAANEPRVAGGAGSFLTAYDAAYYKGWPRRTCRFARLWQKRFPWLPALCRRLEKDLPALAALPQTVIHGEYYPHNILFQAGVVRPVDWQTAAIAPGEIDLATLGDGWPQGVCRQLEAEYGRARWRGAPPAGFQRNLELARIYLHLRWLGDRPEWTSEKESIWRCRRLYTLCKRFGFL